MTTILPILLSRLPTLYPCLICQGFLGQWMTAEATLLPESAQNNGMCLHFPQGTHPAAVPQPAPLCAI